MSTATPRIFLTDAAVRREPYAQGKPRIVPVAIVAERLKQCTVHPDNIAGVDGLGRDYGCIRTKYFCCYGRRFQSWRTMRASHAKLCRKLKKKICS